MTGRHCSLILQSRYPVDVTCAIERGVLGWIAARSLPEEPIHPRPGSHQTRIMISWHRQFNPAQQIC